MFRTFFLPVSASSAVALVSLASLSLLGADAQSLPHATPTDLATSLQSALIWSPESRPGTQAYVVFRKNFELSESPQNARLHVFADSRFLLWVNGKHVLRGPCRFNPNSPEFDSLDVSSLLHKGTNSVVALVHYYGPVTNGRIMHRAPGFTALLMSDQQELLRTDTSWRTQTKTEYLPSPHAWSSIPDIIDARQSPGPWMTPEFNDADWPQAIPVDGNQWGKFQARTIPLAIESPVKDIKVMPSGTPLTPQFPLLLQATDDKAHEYEGGFRGQWMWSPNPAKKVWFKAVWSNAGFGQGKGSHVKILCDNQFTLFLNGKKIASSDDIAVGWTGILDIMDGDILAIEATDFEQGDKSAGLFVSMLNGGHAILNTNDFRATTDEPQEDWKSTNSIDGFVALSPTNIHPAHANPESPSARLVLDLGKMSIVYPELDIEAEEGSVLRITYALRFIDGKPHESFGHGTTYTTRAGRQSFMAADQWVARYMVLHCTQGKVLIHGLKATDRRYPFERIGKFQSSDQFLNQLWEMSVNTIECTSDDAYGSDARERNEWVQDALRASYFTTRVACAGPDADGKKVFSDPRLIRNVLRHAALSQIADGSLLGTFPTDRDRSDPHYVIEDYSLQWLEGLVAYHDASNDTTFIRQMWPTLVRQLDWFAQRITPRGLLKAREYTSFDNPLAYITCEGASLNAFYYRALSDAATLGRRIDAQAEASAYQNQADALYKAFNAELWDAAAGCYSAGFLDNKKLPPSVHAQLMALDRGLVPQERELSTRNWFLTHYKNPGMFHCGDNPNFQKMLDQKAGIDMPIMFTWAFSELYRADSQAMDVEALQEMRQRWKYMVELQQDAGTLSEKFTFADGSGASESCHNYGAVPAYFLSSYVLGVRRSGQVIAKKILIEPRLGDLESAQGTVVTEHGPVDVSWRRKNGSLEFTIDLTQITDPAVRSELRIPEGIANTLQFADTHTEAKTSGRHATCLLPPGKTSGKISLQSTHPVN